MTKTNGKRTVINIGPFHPLQEEAEFYQLYVEGETVVDVDVRISYNHRGIEKLDESKTFDQVPFVVERVCGICSASHPLAYIQAVEEIAHVEVPERALYLRTIVNELERLHSHLLWVGLAGHFLGYNTVFMWAWKYREPVMDILEVTTGSRVNYANCKIGGVRRDMTEEQLRQIGKVADEIMGPIEMLTLAVLDDPVLHARLKGVGILSEEDARAYGASGPTARGSNRPIDVRRDDPYAMYDRVDWKVICEPNGDVLFFFQAEDGIRDSVASRGLGDVYKRQERMCVAVDAETHKPLYTFTDLVKLSQLKTQRMRKEW